MVVTDRFAITGRGLVVAPWLDAAEARPERFAVELRRPDGSTRAAIAFAQIPFLNPPPPIPRVHLALLDVTADDLPLATEIWTDLD